MYEVWIVSPGRSFEVMKALLHSPKAITFVFMYLGPLIFAAAIIHLVDCRVRIHLWAAAMFFSLQSEMDDGKLVVF